MKKSIWALVIGFVIFWNSGFIGAEYGLAFANPFTQLFWRYLALSLILFLYLTVRGQFKRLSLKKVAPHLIIGILAHGVWLSCSLFAIVKGVPAGIVAHIISLQSLATGAFSGWVTGEHTSTKQWIGLSIGFIGVALPILFRLEGSSSLSITGCLLPLGSVTAITIASLYQRKRQLDKSFEKLPLSLSLFYQALGTAVVLFLPALILEDLSTEWTLKFILTLSWLILGVSLLAYYLMWMLIEQISATRVASLFYMGPPVTMFMAWVIFDDKVQLWDILGLVVIVTGLLITRVNFKKQMARLKN